MICKYFLRIHLLWISIKIFIGFFLSLFYKYSMVIVCYKYVYKNTFLITYLNIFAKALVLLVILYYFCKVKTQLFLIN